MDDLWCFNEEALARAVAASRLPVVSAVGHEIDTTICDLVADLRVPTPTAAAEALLPDYHALCEDVASSVRRLSNSTELSWQRAKAALDRLLSAKAMMRPAQMLQERMQTIDYMVRDMENLLLRCARDHEIRLEHLNEKLEALSPARILERGYSVLLDPAGKAVVSPDQIPEGTELTAILAQGRATLVSKGEKK